jgi:hypothetical protein
VVAHADAARDDHQLHAFERDLAATGRVAPERARSLASVAVRQARAHRIPPALLLGVLLVENEPLDSRAVSSAGARGLMQVHPLWRPVLGPRYGFDLADDSTNLAMGAHILAGLLWRARSVDDVERGLLRYNGCRRALRRVRAGAPRSTRAGAVRRLSARGAPPRRAAGGGSLPEPLVHALCRAATAARRGRCTGTRVAQQRRTPRAAPRAVPRLPTGHARGCCAARRSSAPGTPPCPRDVSTACARARP